MVQHTYIYIYIIYIIYIYIIYIYILYTWYIYHINKYISDSPCIVLIIPTKHYTSGWSEKGLEIWMHNLPLPIEWFVQPWCFFWNYQPRLKFGVVSCPRKPGVTCLISRSLGLLRMPSRSVASMMREADCWWDGMGFFKKLHLTDDVNLRVPPNATPPNK